MVHFASRLRHAVDRIRDNLGLARTVANPDLIFRQSHPTARSSRPARAIHQEEGVQAAAAPIAVETETPLILYLIAVLLIVYALYFAASLLLPIAMAVLLSMLLAPIVQLLERLKLPRALASALVVLATLALLAASVVVLAGPVQTWVEKVPEGLRKIEQELQAFKRPLESIAKAAEQLQESANPGAGKGPQRVVIVRPALTDIVFGTPQVLAPMLSMFFLLFFLLTAGDIFLRKLVTIVPTLKEKKRTVEIIRAMEDDISYYLLTFAAVNAGIGVAMGVVTALLGIPNPLLWGTLVALLNFVPYIGAAVSTATLTFVGVITFDSLGMALAAPAIMLILAGLSAEVITPLVLGRGLRLNPVAIFIAIMLWGWLWGIVGVLLAVPLLASFKIICERVEPLAPIAEFLTQYVPPSEEQLAN